MRTYDIGRFFWHVIGVTEDCPLYHRARTAQVKPPYRKCDSFVIRLPRRRALVLGRWQDPEPGKDAVDLLLDALGARVVLRPATLQEGASYSSRWVSQNHETGGVHERIYRVPADRT